MTFDELLDSLLGPTGIPDRLRAANSMFNPVEGVKGSMQASRTLFAPQTSGMGRVEAAGNMLSGIASVAAPAIAASRAGVPAANALADTLTGVHMGAADVGRAVVNRLNQPGDLGTLGSNGGNFRAYHGSPHSFDRFSMDKIGTGEGAQAYGHGLYFAESEGVAKSYRDALSLDSGFNYKGRSGLTRDQVNELIDAEYGRKYLDNITTPRGLADGVMDELIYGPTSRDFGPQRRALREKLFLDIQKTDPGKMYEVQINADPETFLDWDKPMSEQQRARAVIDDALRPMMGDEGLPSFWAKAPADGEAYTRAERALPKGELPKRMADAGIPGIRYLDAGSRTAGDGSRNYVVFDDALIEILRKYGIAGVGLGGAAATGNALSGQQNRHPYD